MGPVDVPGLYAVSFGARWRSRERAEWNDRLTWRGELPHTVLPHGEIELPLYVPAPVTPGAYVLQIDLLQEGGTWFGDGGALPLNLPVEVR